jgi:AbrB family looped-hinge helix DNA binding protein
MPFCGIIFSMKSTMDSAGRIVVPKALRQALGLTAGQLLEIRAGDGRLEIEITPTPVRLKKRGKGVVAVPDVEMPTLTSDQVRDTLERIRLKAGDTSRQHSGNCDFLNPVR